MTRDETTAFAEAWVRDWNGRDLDAILAHCAAEVRFHSPKAAALVGRATLDGKGALATY